MTKFYVGIAFIETAAVEMPVVQIQSTPKPHKPILCEPAYVFSKN